MLVSLLTLIPILLRQFGSPGYWISALGWPFFRFPICLPPMKLLLYATYSRGVCKGALTVSYWCSLKMTRGIDWRPWRKLSLPPTRGWLGRVRALFVVSSWKRLQEEDNWLRPDTPWLEATRREFSATPAYLFAFFVEKAPQYHLWYCLDFKKITGTYLWVAHRTQAWCKPGNRTLWTWTYSDVGDSQFCRALLGPWWRTWWTQWATFDPGGAGCMTRTGWPRLLDRADTVCPGWASRSSWIHSPASVG